MTLFKKKTREPLALSDEEVIREALKAVTSYASKHTEEDFVLNDCVDWALAAVESVWRKARGYSPYRPIFGDDEKELSELKARIAQELRARACKKGMESLKHRKMVQINRATAEAVLSYELRQRGCEFFFEFQTHRARVYVRAGEDHALNFYIRYKDLRQDKLTEILDAAADIAHRLEQSELDPTVTGGWKNWTGWKQ